MKIDPQIQAALDATTLPYEIVPGKRHHKIRVGGKFCGVIPLDCRASVASPRAVKNTIAQIRRAAKEAAR